MDTHTKASLGKRILAIFYDSLIAFFFSFIVILITQTLIIELGIVTLESVKISKSETIQTIPAHSIMNNILLCLWLFIPFLYFAYYWTNKSQTLGMKVWKLKVISNNNESISWLQSCLRYIFALFGLGYLWMLVDKEHLPLQDRISNTRLIRQIQI